MWSTYVTAKCTVLLAYQSVFKQSKPYGMSNSAKHSTTPSNHSAFSQSWPIFLADTPETGLLKDPTCDSASLLLSPRQHRGAPPERRILRIPSGVEPDSWHEPQDIDVRSRNMQQLEWDRSTLGVCGIKDSNPWVAGQRLNATSTVELLRLQHEPKCEAHTCTAASYVLVSSTSMQHQWC